MNEIWRNKGTLRCYCCLYYKLQDQSTQHNMWLFFYLPNVLQRILSNECHLSYRYDNKNDSLQKDNGCSLAPPTTKTKIKRGFFVVGLVCLLLLLVNQTILITLQRAMCCNCMLQLSYYWNRITLLSPLFYVGGIDFVGSDSR
jgi:hypothetical protein